MVHTEAVSQTKSEENKKAIAEENSNLTYTVDEEGEYWPWRWGSRIHFTRCKIQALKLPLLFSLGESPSSLLIRGVNDNVRPISMPR